MKGIKERRAELKITQIELAKQCGVSVNTIIKWENEVAEPNDENYQKLSDALGLLPFGE